MSVSPYHQTSIVHSVNHIKCTLGTIHSHLSTFLPNESEYGYESTIIVLLSKNRYDVPVPVCFKEFSATYYHICSNIYGIKSFILNIPILYVFLCVK